MKTNNIANRARIVRALEYHLTQSMMPSLSNDMLADAFEVLDDLRAWRLILENGGGYYGREFHDRSV